MRFTTPPRICVAAAGISMLVLTGCSGESSPATTSTSTVTTTPSSSHSTSDAPSTSSAADNSPTAAPSSTSAPAGPEETSTPVDPARFAASAIFPEQPGLMFTTTRGDYCEMHPAGPDQPQAQTLCRLNASTSTANALRLSPTSGGVAEVNRPLGAFEGTQVLEAGQSLTFEGMTCTVTPEVDIHCTAGEHHIRVGVDDYEAY